MREPDIEDMINEECARCYDVGFDHGRASQYVECEARIEAAFRAGAAMAVKTVMITPERGHYADIDALWSEYRKGGG